MDGPEYARAVGAGLRRIRLRKGMSLHDVQEASAGRWKAAVVGAYERGDRNVTVARLFELADFYDSTVGETLPEDPRSPPPHPPAPRTVTLNLDLLDRSPEGERGLLERFAAAIQGRRGSSAERVVAIREDDLRALSLLLDVDIVELAQRLQA